MNSFSMIYNLIVFVLHFVLKAVIFYDVSVIQQVLGTRLRPYWLFSAPEPLKRPFYGHLLSVVWPSVRLNVFKRFTCLAGLNLTDLVRAILMEWQLEIVKKGHNPLLKENNCKTVKLGCVSFKTFFSKSNAAEMSIFTSKQYEIRGSYKTFVKTYDFI